MSLLLLVCLIFYARFVYRRILKRKEIESYPARTAWQRISQNSAIRRKIVSLVDRDTLLAMLTVSKEWFVTAIPLLYSTIPVHLVDSIRPPLFGLSVLWRLLLSIEARRCEYARAVTEILFDSATAAGPHLWRPLDSRDPRAPSIFLLAMYFPHLRRVSCKSSGQDIVGLHRALDSLAVEVKATETDAVSSPLVGQRSWEIRVSRRGPRVIPSLEIDWEIRIKSISQLQENSLQVSTPSGWPALRWRYRYTLVIDITSTTLRQKGRVRDWIVERVSRDGDIHALELYSLGLDKDELGKVAAARRQCGKHLDRLVLGYPMVHNPRDYEALIESAGALALTDLALALYVSPQTPLQDIFAPIQRHCRGVKRLSVVCHHRKGSRATSGDEFPIYWQPYRGGSEQLYFRSTLKESGAFGGSETRTNELALQVLWAISGVTDGDSIIWIADSRSGLSSMGTSHSVVAALDRCRRVNKMIREAFPHIPSGALERTPVDELYKMVPPSEALSVKLQIKDAKSALMEMVSDVLREST